MRRRATERVRTSCSPEEVLQQLGVRAGVRAVLWVERILFSPLPEPLDRDPLAGPRISRGVARRIDVRALDRLELQAALGAGEADAVALPGRVCGQVIGEGGAGRVPDDRGHVVLDADSIAEDALVTQIAVLVLGVEIKRLQSGVGPQVERKRVLTRRLAARASVVEPGDGPRLRVVAAVESEASEAEDRLRSCSEPPVDEVEVVARLVNH